MVGLAVARTLAKAGGDVLVLEQHALIGSETSSRNSEVVHAGLYYPQNSLKARLCVEGRDRLYAFCESHHVAYRRLGKLIVATDSRQFDALNAIHENALANGVCDLERLTVDQVQRIEPSLTATAALLSPSTGIVDTHGYMLALQGELEDCGGMVAFNSPVEAVTAMPDGQFCILVDDGDKTEISARRLVLSAGLHTSKLLESLNTAMTSVPPPHRYAKGNYFRLEGRAPFSHLIYPVPEPGGLGVHLTLDLAGQARFGPDVEWVETPDYAVDPQRGARFYSAIRRYWPDLKDGALKPDYAGIRPKLVSQGEPAADFRIDGPREHGVEGLLVLTGIESPGLTASLAIADEAMRRLAG